LSGGGRSRLHDFVHEVVVLRHLEKGRGGSPEPPAGN
jgi:hypothetical protein